MLTVLGAGAIGLTLAARLARGGLPVRVCTRLPAAARAIAEHGIEVEEPDRGVRWQATPRAALAGAPRGVREPVFLCVRGPDTEDAAAALAAADADAPLVNVQNGVTGDAVLARHFACVIGAVIRQSCTRVAAYRVRAQSHGRIVVGAHRAGAGPEVEAVAALLRTAGYEVAVSGCIAEDRWLKLCVNLMSTPNALVRPREHETRAFTAGKARLLEEARLVLAAAGIRARSCDGRDRSLDQEIEYQRSALEHGRAARRLPLYNSVWQGLRRGAPLEVDAYHRTVVELGARAGIATPANARMLAALERAVGEGLGPESFGAEELFGGGT